VSQVIRTQDMHTTAYLHKFVIFSKALKHNYELMRSINVNPKVENHTCDNCYSAVFITNQEVRNMQCIGTADILAMSVQHQNIPYLLF
jgi:hypothetical protein